MSYIRTRDGRIVDTTKYPEHPASWSVQASDYALTIAKADTIEELCDEIVIDNWKERGKPVYCFKYVKETKTAYCIDGGGYITLFIPKMLECGCIIKGAIWTSKGLIYVAKMNDKGKLVLI